MLAETVLQDLRIGSRVLIKEKSFCALAVFVLALGICGVTTMFSVVNGVMLRGFSFPNAERMMNVNFIDPSRTNFFGTNGQISAMDFAELAPEQRSFELIANYLNGSTVNVTIADRPERLTGGYTSDTFFRILGVGPIVGRDFTPADNRVGAEKVAIISYALWQREFGGTTDVVGRNIRINGMPATIVGVMPKGFSFPTNEELWIPLNTEFPPKPRNDPRGVAPAVLGLLRRDVSLEQANSEITAFAQRFAATYPDTNRQFATGLVEPLIRTFTPLPLRGTLWTMLAFCVGVLLIACVNVMNMQFARATLRAKELAVRSSLGATRWRLVRQMLTETLLVAALGTAIGVGLAYVAVDWLWSTLYRMDNPPPAWMVFEIDGRVLAGTVVAMAGAAIVSGLLPALISSRSNVVEVMRDGGRGATSRRVMAMSRGLVVLQIVVTCILLIGSILQVRSIVNQRTLDYGYDTGSVLTARMGLMDGDYPAPEARKQFYDRLLRQLSRTPDLAGAALTNRMRMVFSGSAPIEIDGKTYADKRDRPTTNFEQVTGGFFDAIGVKRLEGRTFIDDDLDAKQPVAIVNSAFVSKHFPGESALGRRFRTVDPNTEQPGPWRTIVGVVATVRMQPPINAPNADATGFYVPFYSAPTGPAQPGPFASQFATVVVRPREGQSPDGVAAALRNSVGVIDPNLPLYFVGTPKRHLDAFVAQNSIVAWMFSIFGLVAVVLASVGMYGVTSFAVSQRTQEFGVRMALGADASRILRMVLQQGTRQLAIGMVLGVGLAFGLATLLASAIGNTLFGVSARDPLSYSAVIALVAVVSLVATVVPARRATRVDPMVALRID